MISRRWKSAAALSVAGIVLAACGGGSSMPTNTTTSLPKAKVSHAMPITSTTVTINGKEVAVPREEYAPGTPIQVDLDKGQQVLIVSNGALPRTLLAPPDARITWTNLSSTPVTVYYVSVGSPGVLGPIPPGGHQTLFPVTGGNISFITSTGYQGLIQVGTMPLPSLPTTTSP